MREVVRAAIDEVPEGPAKNSTVNMIRKNVDMAVMAAVNAAWGAAVSSCAAMKDTLEETVKKSLDPIFEQEGKLKVMISSTAKDTVNPFLEDVGGRLCQPLLKACSNPATKAYVAGVKGFANYMKEKLCDCTKDNMQAKIKEAHQSVNYWSSGPMKEVNEICWNLYTNDLADVMSFFGSGYSAYKLYSAVLDSIKDVTHRAMHGFATALEEANFEGHAAILSATIVKYVHDAQLALKNVLEGILEGILRSPFETLVITPCLELVKPIQDSIDEIPIPGLSDLLNLSSLTEAVLKKFRRDCIEAIVGGAFEPVAAQLQDAGKDL